MPSPCHTHNTSRNNVCCFCVVVDVCYEVSEAGEEILTLSLVASHVRRSVDSFGIIVEYIRVVYTNCIRLSWNLRMHLNCNHIHLIATERNVNPILGQSYSILSSRRSETTPLFMLKKAWRLEKKEKERIRERKLWIVCIMKRRREMFNIRLASTAIIIIAIRTTLRAINKRIIPLSYSLSIIWLRRRCCYVWDGFVGERKKYNKEKIKGKMTRI
jgi:hypothetical protein